MIATHQHSVLHTYGGYDPTRTTSLRNMFIRELKGRFKELKRLIRIAIVDKDCFGIAPVHYQMNPPVEGQFAFAHSADKVSGFMGWLQEQVDKGVLEVKELNQVGKSVNAAWQNKYIYDSYKRGVIRARYELKKAGFDIPSIEATGGIEISMSTPLHLDRLGLLYTRVYTELKGTVNDMMDKQISRILTQGIADGDNPRLLARKLVASIDGSGIGKLGLTDSLGRFIPAERRAEILARTEIIRAHHVATIQEYRNWGAEGVTVQAEFKTAGDDRVCSQCTSLEGNVYTLDQIEGMIPVHPQCRCVASPVLPIEKAGVEERLTDDVADGFINVADGKEYLKYKKGYDKLLAKQEFTSDQIKAFVNGKTEGQVIKSFFQGLHKADMPNAFKAIDKWQIGTYDDLSMQLKYYASTLEKKAGKMVYPDYWGLKDIEMFNTKASTGGFFGKDEYLKLRALNQSYMDWQGIKGEEVLYRGTDGKVGQQIAEWLRANKNSNLKYSINDACLSGYTTDAKRAIGYGKKEGGVTIGLTNINKSDIVVHTNMLGPVIGAFHYEKEYIIIGGKKTINIADIIF